MNLERIARLAGVSRATVSRVINDYPYVSDEVRQRVLAIIEQEGFQPNAAARMLVRQRTDVIGVISPEGLGSTFSTAYFPMLFEGISAGINQTDYAMSLWMGSTPEENERIYKRILGYKMMDGALLISNIEGDTLPQRFFERRMPLVMIGPATVPGVSTVDVDNIAAARTATEHLIRLGRQRIAHITGNMALASTRDRLQGYRVGMEASRSGFNPQLVIEGEYNEESGYWAARKLITKDIDALFAGDDLIATGAIRAFQEQGLSVPKDISVVGFNDLPMAATNKPALTTVRQPIRDIGRLAVKMLIDLIDNKITPPHRLVMPTELIIRDTCGALIFT